MKQRAHRLKGNKRCYWPQQIIYVDTETHGYTKEIKEHIQTLNFGYAQYVSYRKKESENRKIDDLFFTTKNAFCKWLEEHAKPKRRLVVLASNIWFDMCITGIHWYLIRSGYKITMCYQGGLTTIIEMVKDKTTILFLSIQNMLPVSIESIGRMIGIPKLHVDFDTTPQDDLIEYCKRDVEILRRGFEYWKQTCLDHDFGNFGITLPAQSFNLFRHKHMKHAIFVHDSPTAIGYERQAYYGGRTECFYIGKIPEKIIYKLDINSMYPYVMRNNVYPTKLIGYINTKNIDNLYVSVDNTLIIADCTVEINSPICAHRHKQHTLFPTGTIRGCFCNPTLKLIMKHGKIKKLHGGTIYASAPIFKTFVDDLNALKVQATKDNDAIRRFIFKRIMNSLYGKFGQKQREVVYEHKTDPEYTRNEMVLHIDDKRYYHVIAFGGREKWYTTKDENSFNAFVAIAAYVTDYARCLLWGAIEKAGRENVYYCDTDSMFVNQKGMDNMESDIHNTKLGKWKLEDTTDTCVLKGPKWYIWGDSEKCKGISKNAIMTKEGKYKQVYFPSFRASLKNDITTGYVVKTIEKSLTTDYKKGIVNHDGRVTPIVF